MRAVRWMLILLIAGVLAVAVGAAPLRVAQAADLRAGAQQASGAALASGGGAISGQVVNGSLNNAAVAGQSVILQFSVGTTIHDLRTVTTDHQGRFSFANVAPTAATDQNYAVYTHFQGGVYSSAPIQLKAGATQHTQIIVYTATQNPANLSVSVATVLFRDIDAQPVAWLGELWRVFAHASVRAAGHGRHRVLVPTGEARPLRFLLPTRRGRRDYARADFRGVRR